MRLMTTPMAAGGERGHAPFVPETFSFPRNVSPQIAVRIAQAEAGGLQEVVFMLFDQKTLDVWREAARAAGLQEVEGGSGSDGEL